MICKITRGFILNHLTSLLALFFMIGCGGYHSYVAPDPIPDDRYPVAQPAEKDARKDLVDAIDQQVILQGEQLLDFSRLARNFSGNPKEAYNVDAFDEVPNSSWFTNRNARKRLSIPEIVRGPDTGNGPDTSNFWTVVSAKAEGVTPGFTIVDSRGEKYVIKFDPIGYSGLNSGVEVIGSKLFSAAGYNVPENYITFFDAHKLKLGKKVKFTDEKGKKRYMKERDLQEILNRVERLPNGLIRATASKYIPGEPIGPFSFDQRRKDDPNDFIPHQHRRELRGLQVMAAWLNHVDSKSANTMDSYVIENGRGYVKHFLIDFGTILGSGARGPQPKYRGHENEIDPHAILFRTLTLGLYIPDWERVPDEVEYPCIGRFDSEFYHPKKFKIIYPNPAYDNQTDRDGYWGAKLVMSFTDEQLRAVIEQAQYPDLEAAEYLLKTLTERRDITGRYWFNRVAPLDQFELKEGLPGNQELHFTDLAVETGLEAIDHTNYRYTLKYNGELIYPKTYLGSQTWISLPRPNDPHNNRDMRNGTEAQWEVSLQVKRGEGGKWSKCMKVYLEQYDGKFKLLGLRRQS